MRAVFAEVFDDLERQMGAPEAWSFGAMHQIQFWHTLRRREPWQHMQVGPAPIGGSATTLAMGVHMGPGPGADAGEGRIPQRVWHGPAYRLVVDLADPHRCRFVIASGNSGRPGSTHVTDHFETWLAGRHHTVHLRREDLDIEETWRIVPAG